MKQYAKVSNTNSKLGGQIYSINLPPVVTCRADAPCFKGVATVAVCPFSLSFLILK